MDPFSIAAGSVGIAGVATTGFGQLHRRISSFREAPVDIKLVRSNLEDVRRPLVALEQLSLPNEPNAIAIKRDLEKVGLVDAVNKCGDECDKFAKSIERWTKHSNPDKLVFWDRFLVGVWHKEKFRTFSTQLQSCAITVQLAVETAQFRAQLRSEKLSEASRESIKTQLHGLETRISTHLNLIGNQLAETQSRIEQLEDDHDGTPEVDQAIDEARRRAEILQANQISCGVVFAQAESSRSGIDIGKVLTSDKSIAFVGLPASVVGRVNLRVGEVATQGGSTSHVGVFGSNVNA